MRRHDDPPAFLRTLLERALPPSARHEVVGDLEEDFRSRLASGRRAARHWYRRQAMRLIASFGRLRLAAVWRGVLGAAARGIGGDLRYAARILRRSPLLSAAAIGSLAVGIGAAATVFAAVNALLIKPLPGADPDGLVRVFTSREDDGERSNGATSWPRYLDLREDAATLQGLAATARVRVLIEADGRIEVVSGEVVSANYFEVLGVPLVAGRAFGSSADDPGGDYAAVVLSHEFWTRAFSGDRSVIGRTIRLDAHPFTVTGVAAESFHGENFAVRTDVWAPAGARSALLPRSDWSDRGERAVRLIGRLRPGITPAVVEDDLTRLAAALAARHPAIDARLGVRVLDERPGLLQPDMPEAVSAATTVALLVAGLVVLVASVNVGSLLLARGVARLRETALRVSLGATRGRLLRQSVIESIVLATPAAPLGVALAYQGAGLYTAFMPPLAVTPMVDFAPDLRVALFAAGLSVIAAIVTALAPMVWAGRTDPAAILQSDPTGGVAGGARLRMLDALAVTQLAFATAVLVAAAMLVRTLQHYETIDPGFDADRGLTIAVEVDPRRHPGAAGRSMLADIVTRVGAIPGVESASLAARGLLTLTASTRVIVPGATGQAGAEGLDVAFNVVSPDYFRTVGIPVRRGRAFAPEDGERASPVAIVNQTFADRFWPGADPVGQHIRLADDDRFAAIVGVAADAKYDCLACLPRAFLYLPFDQRPQPAALLHVRAAHPAAAAPLVREAIAAIDPTLVRSDTMLLASIVASDLWLPRTAATLGGSIAAFILLLAVVGLTGVMAYATSRRAKEFAVRLALGSSPRDLVRLVLSRALKMTAAGTALGIGLALVIAQALASVLVGVSATDPASFLVVVTLIAAAGLVACWAPVWRTLRIDVIGGLRRD